MNKVAIVTGSSSGLGLEIVKELKYSGYKVIGVSRTKPDVNHLLDEHYAADLSCIIAVRDFIDDLKKSKFINECKIIVHNAGALQPVPLILTEVEDAKELMQLHYFTPLMINNALIETLIKNKTKMMFIGSISAEHSAPFLSTYSSSKAALRRYADGLRRELKGVGPSVIYVELGNLSTNFCNENMCSEMPIFNGVIGYDKMKEKFISKAVEIRKKGSEPAIVAKTLVERLKQKRTPKIIRLGSSIPRSIFLRTIPSSISDWCYEKVLGKPRTLK